MIEREGRPARGRGEKCEVCDRIWQWIGSPFWLLSRVYVFIFGRVLFQSFNDFVFETLLKARGYNNCCDLKTTGERNFLKLVARLNPTHCIDVGANVGAFSQRLLETTGASVLAFEPLPLAFDKLRQLQDRYPNRFVPISKGLGSVPGMFDLAFGKENIELATFSSDARKIDYVEFFNNDTVKAEVVTLDAFIESTDIDFDFSNVDLLKIDTEGFEQHVLLGAKNFIATRRPKLIQIEYNWHQLFTGHTLYSFAALLSGYEAFVILPYGTKLKKVDPSKPDNNIFHFSNFVFIRNDVEFSRYS
ncbi:FkbM family methyltransferase [Asticcacaulis sp. MM231]|uniref:FkbM family methyltransferase n=1 Tax=Asticcacaulis sp. MM231 TaxID=3157666 RepID=UPI0032D57F5E